MNRDFLLIRDLRILRKGVEMRRYIVRTSRTILRDLRRQPLENLFGVTALTAYPHLQYILRFPPILCRVG